MQARAEMQDATGSVVWIWLDAFAAWAAIEPMMGREYFAAAQIQSDATVRIRIRYRTGVTPKMRVRHVAERGSPTLFEYYEIESVISPREEGRELVLMCRKLDAQGFRGETLLQGSPYA